MVEIPSKYKIKKGTENKNFWQYRKKKGDNFMKRRVLFAFLILGVIVLGKVGLSMINASKLAPVSPLPTTIFIDEDDGSAGWLGLGNGDTSEK